MTKQTSSHSTHSHFSEALSREVTDTATVLRAGGFRVTSGRVVLLSLLETIGAPLSVQSIIEHWPDSQLPDTATLYRSLTDLQAAGIVRRVDLGTGTAHFEYTPTRPHHHHIVCTSCGDIEELDQCSLDGVEAELLITSNQFKSIYSHNLEFFGLCTECAVLK